MCLCLLVRLRFQSFRLICLQPAQKQFSSLAILCSSPPTLQEAAAASELPPVAALYMCVCSSVCVSVEMLQLQLQSLVASLTSLLSAWHNMLSARTQGSLVWGQGCIMSAACMIRMIQLQLQLLGTL